MQLDPNLVIFYVENPLVSLSFYERLLQKKPVESSPTFVMFVLKSGMRLGLWAKQAVKPQAALLGGGNELSLQVEEDHFIDELYSLWQNQGIQMAQPPAMMDFGYTFVALDPDQHRLRVVSLHLEKKV
ncbi:drug:proton antiporter [Fluoribacter dumoffii]|uniref:Glyoxalase-like domain n=1 Tax=Fluoribacter dumoffii TaxID=463 RepID=A0A377GDH5_9GAMM|nr:VOC family protein [Fluoribacter dumoffii]KTC90687.1 bleomycin resistance protein [Fluoribacter dumoffii NY 23]MCW8419420.1 drug:proton antiporter [Fluoribacter dumoffii]MCW8452705.1 drug:proton antiporter [Fluoribacter dumoffii]MCW8460045.1 drug:proton antiporter [Fluoribacter dumoffii]MCW8483523.1 drug:proton antiporter [Fluoribacter dumoffii]